MRYLLLLLLALAACSAAPKTRPRVDPTATATATAPPVPAPPPTVAPPPGPGPTVAPPPPPVSPPGPPVPVPPAATACGLRGTEPVTGRIVQVPGGASLQAAVDAASAGDVLVLTAGATYAGPIVIPEKPCSGCDGWTTVRGEDVPVPGRRASPAAAARMPKIAIAAGAGPALRFAARAHHWRIVGLEVRPQPGAFVYSLLEFGDDSMPTADLPHHLSLEGLYLHGDPQLGGRRGVGLNSRSTCVRGSYVADFKEQGADSQAIAGWSGPGPFIIENNYLEGAGENVLFGGVDPPGVDRIPSDIVVRGNHVAKPASWRAQNWTVKNIFELKNAQRVLVEGNLFEGNWAAAQNGFSILFTVRNQDGGAQFSTIREVTFRGNVVRNAANGINVLGQDNIHASQRVEGLVITDNYIDVGGTWGDGKLLQLLNGADRVTFAHNTCLHTGTAIVLDERPTTGFVFRDNIVSHNAYGIIGSGTAPGNGTIAQFLPGAVVRRNVIAGAQAAAYPSDNFYPPDVASITKADARGFRVLASGGPYAGAGTDGKDLGADAAMVAAALAARQ